MELVTGHQAWQPVLIMGARRSDRKPCMLMQVPRDRSKKAERYAPLIVPEEEGESTSIVLPPPAQRRRFS